MGFAALGRPQSCLVSRHPAAPSTRPDWGTVQEMALDPELRQGQAGVSGVWVCSGGFGLSMGSGIWWAS